jgi:hypothetical protein
LDSFQAWRFDKSLRENKPDRLIKTKFLDSRNAYPGLLALHRLG